MRSYLVLAALTVSVGCGSTAPTVNPDLAQADDSGAEETEPEPEPARRVGDGELAIGTFNLNWAHAPVDGKAPKLKRENAAQTTEDWSWKVQQIAEVLAREKLDIVAVQEVGGESELMDITIAVNNLGGPDYTYGWIDNKDPYTGHYVAVLSRLPLLDERAFEIDMRKHVAVDIALPDESYMTVVAFHARGGKYANQVKARAKQAKALKKEVERLRGEHPVVVLGTANARRLPDEPEYERTSLGVLTGLHTKDDADDCQESGSFLTGQRTTVAGLPLDRIVSCGLELTDIETSGEEGIVRDAADPKKLSWSQVPIEDAPYRDVSDHFVLWGRFNLPPKK